MAVTPPRSLLPRARRVVSAPCILSVLADATSTAASAIPGDGSVRTPDADAARRESSAAALAVAAEEAESA